MGYMFNTLADVLIDVDSLVDTGWHVVLVQPSTIHLERLVPTLPNGQGLEHETTFVTCSHEAWERYEADYR